MPERYRSEPVSVGHLRLGGDLPVRIQSMANTDTNDQEASWSQCRRMVEAGAELVRFTTQGRREVESLEKIRDRLRTEGIDVPVAADIHFNPKLALWAAGRVDKIRINPGNYLKGNLARNLLPSLLNACRVKGTAIRIGVNHGSLDQAIINKYGNSPEGMVASALPFLEVCRKMSFRQVVVSMKSSNPVVMIRSVRLLVSKMRAAGLAYPLHLGVTEAGGGLEGRIRSAVGMAPLLLEGMGDTVRVSLTGPPEAELPVASALVRLFPKPDRLPYDPLHPPGWDPFAFERRRTASALFRNAVGSRPDTVIVSPVPPDPATDLRPEKAVRHAVTYTEWRKDPGLLENGDRFLLLEKGRGSLQEAKMKLGQFCRKNNTAPVVYKTSGTTADADTYALEVAGELGYLLSEGALSGVWVENPHIPTPWLNQVVLHILQASGARTGQAEYIACPSCGRTHFDILSRLEEVRHATSHLKSLKIAVMGCIVNGPGEMADAHYGYVGAGRGRVTIYRGKEPVRNQVPESEALVALIDLIRQEGDWIDP